MKAIETDIFENINKDPLILLNGTRESSLSKRRKDASDINPSRSPQPAFGCKNTCCKSCKLTQQHHIPSSAYADPRDGYTNDGLNALDVCLCFSGQLLKRAAACCVFLPARHRCKQHNAWNIDY